MTHRAAYTEWPLALPVPRDGTLPYLANVADINFSPRSLAYPFNLGTVFEKPLLNTDC